MPRSSPYEISLSPKERRILEARARKYTLPYRDVFRASLILLAAQGLRNDQIAEHLNTRREIVSKWRSASSRTASKDSKSVIALAGAEFFPPELVVAVKAIACELPSQLGLPLSRLHVPDIRAEVISRGLVGEHLWDHDLAVVV